MQAVCTKEENPNEEGQQTDTKMELQSGPIQKMIGVTTHDNFQ
jgi:hypothetical protein